MQLLVGLAPPRSNPMIVLQKRGSRRSQRLDQEPTGAATLKIVARQHPSKCHDGSNRDADIIVVTILSVLWLVDGPRGQTPAAGMVGLKFVTKLAACPQTNFKTKRILESIV